MKLDYMREFITLAQVKNYSRAAEKLFISQSTLSKHVSAMEGELGVHLLNHDYRGVELTGMGDYALEVFQQIVEAYDALKSRAEEAAQGLRGELRIGVPYYATRKVLAPMLKKFADAYPSISVTVSSGQPDLVHEMLLDGDLDAAVNMYCRTMEVPNGDALETTELTREKQVLLSDPVRFTCSDGAISIGQLEGRTLVCFESGALSAAFARSVRARFVERGVNVSWIEPVRNVDLLSDAVLESGACAVVPSHVAAFHPDLSATEIGDLFPNRMAFYSEKKAANPAVALFRSVAVAAAKTIRL